MADPNVRRVVNGIQLSVKTLERLFDSLLDISRIESGVIKPNVVERGQDSKLIAYDV